MNPRLRAVVSPRGITLLVILGLGLWVILADPVDRDQLFAWGEWFTAHPVTLIGVVLLQIALFAFALPGSMLLWVVAPFLSFLLAVALLVVGSVGGALAAWLVARWLGGAALSRVDGHPAYALLARNADPFTQCALRILPGFPHSVINYAGGVLALPLPGFLLAATVGLTVKWALYVSAIHALLEAGDDEAAGVDAMTLLPLLLLAVFLVGGRWLAQRLVARRKGNDAG